MATSNSKNMDTIFALLLTILICVPCIYILIVFTEMGIDCIKNGCYSNRDIMANIKKANQSGVYLNMDKDGWVGYVKIEKDLNMSAKFCFNDKCTNYIQNKNNSLIQLYDNFIEENKKEKLIHIKKRLAVDDYCKDKATQISSHNLTEIFKNLDRLQKLLKEFYES